MNNKNKKVSKEKELLEDKLTNEEKFVIKDGAVKLKKWIEELMEGLEDNIPNIEKRKKEDELVEKIRNEVIDEVFSNAMYFIGEIISEEDYEKQITGYLNIYLTYLTYLNNPSQINQFNIKAQNNQPTSPDNDDENMSYIR